MREVEIINVDYLNRLNQVLDESWKIFKSQFVNHRNEIKIEASFQLHFARIISDVGFLYSISKDDIFNVDLETQCKDVKGKSKYIDITCGFREKEKCAIELKFKTHKQSAQDLGRIYAYIDLEALETVVFENKYDLGKFYWITDSPTYIYGIKGGVGLDFETKDTYVTNPEKQLIHSQENWKDSKEIVVRLRNKYVFNWEEYNDNGKKWYFLELTIQK